MEMAVGKLFSLALAAVVVVLAIADVAAQVPGGAIGNQPRHVFVQNRLGHSRRMAIMCWLNKKRVWRQPLWLNEGKEVTFTPDDSSPWDFVRIDCAVASLRHRKWCLFKVYDSNLNFGHCLGFGCRWQIRDDGIYYGLMQDEFGKYTGGPYFKISEWCKR